MSGIPHCCDSLLSIRWLRASGHASVSHRPRSAPYRSIDLVAGGKEYDEDLRVLKGQTKEGCSDARGSSSFLASQSGLRGIFKVIKHEINRCTIPSASLQLQPLQTPQIHSIMVTSSLLSTALSTNDLPSIFSHLPSYYQKSAEEQIRSAGGEDALSTFKRCSEYADSYAQSFDEKTYRSFDARYSDLIQQIDLQVCMEVPCFEEGRERFNHTMTDFWECVEVPKVIRAFFLKTKPPPDQNEAVMLAMASLLHADQSVEAIKSEGRITSPSYLKMIGCDLLKR
jgi:hypothetical protein